MDSLFSNIQQTLQQSSQQNNQDSLLQNQKISQDKINELLSQSADALLCGPACQKLKVKEELKQKYLDAQTNIMTAPIELERTKKNYYVFSEGESYYDNELEKELIIKSKKITQLLGENFNDELSNAKTMNDYLNIALINSSYIKDLLDSYESKNEALILALKDNRGDILTNDRKTFYATQEIDRLELWYKIWYRMFYILYTAFLICWIVCESTITWPIKTVVSLLISSYPFYIDYVLRKLYGLFAGIYKRLPKNVYNNL